VLSGYKKFDPSKLQDPKGQVFQWDPSTMNELGPPLQAMSKDEVWREREEKKSRKNTRRSEVSVRVSWDVCSVQE
jgi:hypothetical protein